MNHTSPQLSRSRHVAKTTSAAQLRILATTDLHANLLPYDYFSDQGDMPYGLARVASLIRDARAECANSLLFDNGDMLQGTPMSDIAAQSTNAPHPAIMAMNHLRYDAATLGNHEFNFGLPWLENTMRAAQFPITCANIAPRKRGAPAPFWSKQLILDRDILDFDGQTHSIRIGVLGLLPPQTTTWDAAHLDGQLRSHDMVETARQKIPELRTQGADLVVVLAHTGIGAIDATPNMENAALPLSRIPGVDAMIIGHIHGVFPSEGFAGHPGVNALAGALHNTPCVMAGFRGSHLGMLDLSLEKRGGQWQVKSHRAEARPVAHENKVLTPVEPTISALLTPAHDDTLTMTRQPIGTAAEPLHSYLSLVGINPAERLIAAAKRASLTQALSVGKYTDLPILVSVAPFKSGGRGGPAYFTDIAPGPVALRHAADLYAFPNTMTAAVVDGAWLRDWLERAAICFHQIAASTKDMPLLNVGVPSHAFEIVDGLTYEIDLRAPPRYALSGALVNPDARRIRNLSHHGQPIAETDRFVLATNSYRAAGVGQYPSIATAKIIHQDTRPIRDLIVDFFRNTDSFVTAHSPIWSFAKMPGTSVIFQTGPAVRTSAIRAQLRAFEDLGDTADGFARLRLHL